MTIYLTFLTFPTLSAKLKTTSTIKQYQKITGSRYSYQIMRGFVCVGLIRIHWHQYHMQMRATILLLKMILIKQTCHLLTGTGNRKRLHSDQIKVHSPNTEQTNWIIKKNGTALTLMIQVHVWHCVHITEHILNI